MPLITDPDQLNDSAIDDSSAEVFIDPAAKTIKLNTGVGNLIAQDGVTIKAAYSFVKEEFTNDPHSKNLAAFAFPFQPITDEFFELIEGWDWADAATQQSIRRGGWLVRDGSGNVIKHFAGVAILGAESDDQIRYELGVGATPFTFQGNTAEAIQVIDDPNGDGNYVDGFDRSGNVVAFNREQGQLFSSASTVANGESSLLAPKLFSLTVGTGADLNIAASDVTISGSAPYTGMSITRFAIAQQRDIGGTNRDFGWIIDGNNGTKQEIYEFVQWALRQSTDQDSGTGTLLGNVMPELLEFVGSNLQTKAAENTEGGGTGVYIDNFQAVDTNDLTFTDNSDIERTFPFVAALSLNFNTQLVNDTDARYWVYYTDGVNAGSEWGNSGAVIVENNSAAAITGIVSGQATISTDFDYDNEDQAGHIPGTDTNITVVAIGLNTGQYVRATGTITRSNANSVSLVSAVERQYENVA